MAKQVLAFNYLRAIQVLYGEWLSISHTDYCEEETNDITVVAESITPEDLIIKKEAWEELSNEAQEVIMTILSAPSEILEILKTPQRKLLTKRSIEKYFRNIWHSKFIAGQTIREIKNWAREL